MRKSTKISATLGVVAGLAVAFAPLAAFAEQKNVDLGTDTITVTIAESCNMEAEGYDDGTETGHTASTFTNNYVGELEAGRFVDLDSSNIQLEQGQSAQATSITIKCNDSFPAGDTTGVGHGWQIKATGEVLTGENTAATIPMVDPVEDGSVSGWGVKLSKTTTGGDIAITSGYDTGYKAVNATGVVVAKGAVSGGNAGDTLNIVGYRVSATASQKADTYEGDITYTFIAPAM